MYENILCTYVFSGSHEIEYPLFAVSGVLATNDKHITQLEFASRDSLYLSE